MKERKHYRVLSARKIFKMISYPSMKKKIAHPKGKVVIPEGSLGSALLQVAKKYPYLFLPKQRLLFSFLQGALYGTGFVFAVALAVPITVMILRQIEWVPLLGDFMGDISAWMASQSTSVVR